MIPFEVAAGSSYAMDTRISMDSTFILNLFLSSEKFSPNSD